METNFFQLLADLKLIGNFNMTINLSDSGQMVVSYSLNTRGYTDPAVKQISPFVLRGTPEEVDQMFLSRLSMPISSAVALADNTETFLQQLKKAEENTKQEKQKEKDYKEAMKKVDDLYKEGKFREAYMKIPTTAQFADKAEELSKRRNEISAKFETHNLFNNIKP